MVNSVILVVVFALIVTAGGSSTVGVERAEVIAERLRLRRRLGSRRRLECGDEDPDDRETCGKCFAPSRCDDTTCDDARCNSGCENNFCKRGGVCDDNVCDDSVRKPVTQRPTTKQPTTKQPTTKRPTTKRPTTKRPTTKSPTTRSPTTNTPTRQPTDAPTPPTNTPTNNPTGIPTFAKSGPSDVVCRESGNVAFFPGGTTQECSNSVCNSEDCIFYDSTDGFISTSCPLRNEVNASQVSIISLSDASEIISNGMNAEGLRIVKNVSKCKTVYGLGPRSKTRMLESTGNENPSGSGKLLSLLGRAAIRRSMGGYSRNVVSLIQGIIRVDERYAGKWTFGARTIGSADVFLRDRFILSTDIGGEDAALQACDGIVWRREHVSINANAAHRLSMFYRQGESESPQIELYGFLSSEEQHARILSCATPDDVDAPTLPPGTVFTFDTSSCAPGYANPRCLNPLCDAAACLNGGICVAPNQCECTSGRGGVDCAVCAGKHFEIFGSCVQIWIVAAGASGMVFFALLIVFQKQVRGAFYVREQARFLELEVKDRVSDMIEKRHCGESSSFTMSAEQLAMLQKRKLDETKRGGMWKAIKNQSDAELKLMKANFIPKAKLKFGAVFASGAAGQVYAAKYDSIDVCVKELFSCLIDPSDLKEFILEASLLSQMSHPHVVRFYGITVDKESLFIVTEMCESNLESYLETAILSPQAKLQLLIQIARGMEYVHSLGIVHRDLKLGNILVMNRGEHVKICDFGVSTCIGDDGNREIVGTPGGIAPEVLNKCTVKSQVKKIDVFSFGMLAWQICAGPSACANLMRVFGEGSELNSAIATRDFRPKISPSWHYVLKDTIRACWDRDPALRPPFSDIVETLADSTHNKAGIAKTSTTGIVGGTIKL